MFIVVDGIDGAGKSTLVLQLAELLGSFNPEVTKEPTDHSKWGKKLRAAAVEGRLTHDQELEYFINDRRHHIDKIIGPALENGRLVISDRYVDSTLAFQTQTPSEAEELYEKLLPEIIVPEVTLILDCPVGIGLERIRERDNGDTTEFENHQVLKRARKIYESRDGENYEHLNAAGTAVQTLEQAIKILVKRFKDNSKFVDVIKRPFIEADDLIQRA